MRGRDNSIVHNEKGRRRAILHLKQLKRLRWEKKSVNWRPAEDLARGQAKESSGDFWRRKQARAPPEDGSSSYPKP
jgi:hypothetical protein